MIAILADDLTSALDGAAPFAQRGLSARVVLREEALAGPDVDVLSIDLDTRFARPDVAAARFERAARALRETPILYKTIDSTLRGNPGTETAGALAGSGRRHAVVAPAFPAAGRITVDGHQLIFGQLVEDTVFARDPRTPVLTGRVADCFRTLDPDRFTVCDAAEDGDLDELVDRLGLSAPILWVGSPGIAGALARRHPDRSATRAGTGLRPASRILVAVGSLHPANADQIAALTAFGAAGVPMTADGSLDPARCSQLLGQAFERNPVVCLYTPRHRLNDGSDPARLATGMATAVAGVAGRFDGLVATGGDTARRIAEALAADALDLIGEVEPGVPYGLLKTAGAELAFATKAGGFGGTETLAACVRRLTGR